MTDKCELIKEVLWKRREILREVEKNCRRRRRFKDAEYYKGKAHGYMQAIELLGETAESIAIELEDNNGNEGHTAT